MFDVKECDNEVYRGRCIKVLLVSSGETFRTRKDEEGPEKKGVKRETLR